MQKTLTEEIINNLYQDRKKQLEQVKELVVLKHYYLIEEKLNSERQLLLDILNQKQNKQEMLTKYSFILDPQYFEQKFLKIT